MARDLFAEAGIAPPTAGGGRDLFAEAGIALPGGKAGDEPSRSWGELGTDLGAGALKGALSIAKLGALVGDKLTYDEGFNNPAVRFIDEFGESVDANKSAKLRAAEQRSQEATARAGKAAQAAVGEGAAGTAARVATEFGVGAWQAVKDPALLANALAEQVPMLGAMGAGARLAGAGTKAALNAAPALAATRAGAVAAAGAGTAGAVGTSMALQGTDIAGDVFNRLMALPDEVWAENVDFAALAKEIGVGAAKVEIAGREARSAGAKAALASGLTSMLPGGRAIERAVAGKGGMSMRAVPKAIFGEARQEGLEEGFGALYANQAVGGIDPKQDLWANVGGSGGQGAALGGIMGGGLTAARATPSLAMPDVAGALRRATAAAGGAINADEVLGQVNADPAQPGQPALDGESAVRAAPGPAPSAAETALLTPRALTSLDRVDAIDRELGAKPPEAADAPEVQALHAERAAITKDWPASVPGAETTFTTEENTRLAARYALMESDALVTSHDASLRANPAYPAELQPRERERAASAAQISGIVQKLDPARLGLSADAATGAPIVGADGLVESGNARSIALKRVYQANGQHAEDYKAFLRANAVQFGITPESVDSMAKPVLVRVRSTPVNRAEFARQANASTVAQMSPAEQARSDAKRIDAMDDLTPTENGDFSTSRDFIRRFVGRLPQTEQSAMIDAGGALSSAGYARVRNAVLAKAYGDSPVLTRMVESMDDNLRNVSRALMIAAPQVAQARQAIGEGRRFDADITPHLVSAVEELGRLKDAGTSVDDALAQAGLMGETYTPETREVLRFLADNTRRPRKMAQFIGAYFDALDAAGDPAQGSLLGDVQAPTTTDLMAAARRAIAGDTNAAVATNPERAVDREAAPDRAGAGRQPGDAPGDGRSNEGDGVAGAEAKLERGEGSATEGRRAEAVARAKDALGDIASILSKHTRAAMLPEDHPGLMPALVKLFDAAIDIVGTDLKAATKWVREQLRADPRTKAVWNRVAPETYRKAAVQALEQRDGRGDEGGLFKTDKLPLLAAYVADDLRAKAAREAQADALDERAAIDRERDGFSLTTAPAIETRKDTSGDMFGGPSAGDVRSAAERKRAAGGKPAGPDLFSDEAAPADAAGQNAPTAAPPATAAPMPGIPGLSMSLAQDAHRGTSFSPERRGEQEAASYRGALSEAWDRAARFAGTDEAAVARITEVFGDVAAGYNARYAASLAAKSRIMSTMIAGGSNFPVARMNKRNATADKRANEASEYLERGIKRLLRAARGPIDNSPESELERVRLNLTQREELQEQMKAANVALRKGDDAALEDLGFTTEQIAELKKPDFGGRTGFPDYKLINNGAEIRRLRERLKSAEERMQDAAAGPVETERPGVKTVEDSADDRLRLIFDGKPSEAVREDLKANGFKWSPRNEAWQRQLTDNARRAARVVLDKHYPPTRADGASSAAPPTGVAEPTRAYSANESDAPYTTDLFGDPLPADRGRPVRARPAGARVSGNVQPEPAVPGDTAAPAGEYRVRTTVGVTTQRKLGASVIKTAADAAAATRYLYKSAVERFDGIVTDKDGKPLAVIGGFKGALTQAAIFPATLTGEAVRVPGAAFVWFSHNHPSGSSKLSRADEFLNATLADVFRGSGIEPKGLLAIGGGRFSFAATPGSEYLNVEGEAIQSGADTTTVPVIEREQVDDDARPGAELASPTQAKDAAKASYDAAKGPGLLLLDAQLHVNAWVPLPKSMLGALRGTGGLNAIYRAVSESNAGRALIVHGGELDVRDRANGTAGFSLGENIAAALANIDVIPIDIINAKTGESAAERGHSIAAGPVLSRAPGVSDVGERNALKAIAENDELFALPRSGAKTVESIAKDIDPSLVVRKLPSEAGQLEKYSITMPNGQVGRLYVRAPIEFGPTLYAFDLKDGEIVNAHEGRPGENPEAIAPDVEDVYIDVSKMKSGGGGGRVYAIAAAYAHNTGRIFIGDPSGLSDEAMRRRPEQMLSSALKYGTTAHLAPHPRQETGDKRIGVPPLKWVYGDDLGNIRRLVEVNLKAMQNAGLDDATIRFDPTTGRFQGAAGEPLSRADIGALAEASNTGGRALAGGPTIARAAVLRALLREEGREGATGGGRDGLLARIASLADNSPQAVSSLFLSRQGSTNAATGGIAINDLDAVKARVVRSMPGMPPVHVLASPAYAPADLRDYIEQRGATRDVEGALHKGEIYLFASGIRDAERAEHVLAEHEAAHFGLRAILGNALPQQMQAIFNLNARLRRQVAAMLEREPGLSLAHAVEEVLVDMPTSELIKLQGWRALVGKVAQWMAAHGFEITATKLSRWLKGTLSQQDQADLFVANLVRDARAFVARKANAAPLAQDIAKPMFSRAPQTDTPEFKAFFRKSRVTEDGTIGGKPRVMYHATVADFNVFKPMSWDIGMHFGTKGQAEDRAAVKAEGRDEREQISTMPAYLRIENPLRLDDEGTWTFSVMRAALTDKLPLSAKKIATLKSLEQIRAWLESQGIDGIVYRNTGESAEGPRLRAAIAKAERALIGKSLFAEERAEVEGLKLAYQLHKQKHAEDSYIAFRPEQIKSAIGNSGAFDPANPDIRFSTAATAGPAPAKTATERAEDLIHASAGTPMPLDATVKALTRVTGVTKGASMVYGLGARLLERITPERVKAGVVSDYGVPEAVIDQRAMMQGRQREQLRGAGALLEKLATLTRAESRVAYEWMNMDGADPRAYVSMMQGLPEESVKVLQEVQQLIDKLSQEAVRLGQLDADTFTRNRFAYLRRSYFKHASEMQTGDTAKRKRAIAILGDQYKGRGMTGLAPMRQIQNVAPEWWKRKTVEGKADTSLKGEKFVRMERRAPSGERTAVLPGVQGDKTPGRLLEVHYVPVGVTMPAKYADWTSAGTWEARDTKGGDVVMWRDFTKDEREKMGEIDEARFAIAKTLHAMIHDIEVGRYMEWLAQGYAKKPGEQIVGTVVEASERYRDTFTAGEWVQVPEAKIPGTSVARYGKLAGQYLPGPIWNDLRQVVGGRFQPLGETYARILTMWKLSKTALSPAVHMNNVMSNFVMADWHDVSAGHVAKALRIILGASKRDGQGLIGRAGNAAARLGHVDHEAATEILARYQNSGGAIGGWVTQEIRNDQLEPIVAALQRELEGAAAAAGPGEIGVMSAVQHLMHARFPQAFKALSMSKPVGHVSTEMKNLIDLYQSEDEFFRLAAWLKAKEDGKSDAEAGKVARRSFLDYSINAPWIQAMRSTAFPFISFTYRALPMLLETAGKRPHKLIKLMALAGALNWLGVMIGGGGDDKERKLLPEEKAGGVWGLVPKLVRLPWNDTNGSPVYLDIRRWIPVGDVADLGQGHSALPLPPALMPGGPLAMLGEVVLNKTAFTGKPITLETDTATEKVGKVADYLWKALMPNVLGVPGTYATQGVADAVGGRTDAFGRQQSVAQALASSVGVKVGSYPEDVLRRNLMAKFNAEKSEIERNIAGLKRQRQQNTISAEDFQTKVMAQKDKERELQQRLTEKMN